MTSGRRLTQRGFYLVTVGAAVGLGNIWRFPYVVSENGGGAFVLLYFFLVFVLGVPMLVGELLLGKSTDAALIPALERLNHRSGYQPLEMSRNPIQLFRFLMSGPFALTLCLLVLSYYAVISGWVLHEIVNFAMGIVQGDLRHPNLALSTLINKGWLQLLLASAHLVLAAVIVAREVDEGIERWVGQMMPIFLVLLLVMAFNSFTMESASSALRFFLYPDFSKLSWSSLAQATGQVLFTLSLGFGTMVTFGSYLGARTNVVMAGYWVAVFDMIVSLAAGLMVFPVVIQQINESRGPLLVFQAVPELLSQIAGGMWFGLGFFVCLYLAALGASISLLETVVANLRETSRLKREHSALIAAVLALVMSIPVALSTNHWQFIRIWGGGLLEWLDNILIDWCLPIAALILSQIVVRRIDRAVQRSEFEEGTSPGVSKLFSHWRFALRWVAPTVISLGLVLQLIGLFRN